MSEITADALDVAIYSVLDGVRDPVTMMSTIACLVYGHDARFDWVGFYRNRGDEILEIGPYQGGLGCLYIHFDKGVCGHVARTRAPINVPDVHAFEGHIACASTTQSEIVIPVINAKGELLGVFDIDSNQPDAFTQDDIDELSCIIDRIFANVPLVPFANAH